MIKQIVTSFSFRNCVLSNPISTSQSLIGEYLSEGTDSQISRAERYFGCKTKGQNDFKRKDRDRHTQRISFPVINNYIIQQKKIRFPFFFSSFKMNKIRVCVCVEAI